MLLRILRGLGILAWFGLLLGVFVFSANLSFSRFVRRGEVTLPRLTGLSLEEGESQLAELGVRLALREDADRFDTEVPPGRIVDQIPKGGTPAKRGSVVEVALSRGRELVDVPDLLGQPMQTVLVNLKASGLSMGRVLRVFAASGEEGKVVRQHPLAETKVDPMTPVDLFVRVAGSKESLVMPDLISRDYEAVRHFFELRGFRVGSIKYEAYEGAAPGSVLRQYPLPGHRLGRRDVISLVVSAGGRVAENSL